MSWCEVYIYIYIYIYIGSSGGHVFSTWPEGHSFYVSF